MSSRFRRLTDLFVEGRPVALPDGTYLWVQAVNAFERDECVNDAHVARSRLVLALRNNGDERVKVEARLIERGRDALISELAGVKTDEKYPNIISELEDDPEWSERVEILRRTDVDESAKPETDDEKKLLETIWADYYAEIGRRLEAERDWLVNKYSRVDDVELLDAYVEAWLERRGRERANAEFSLSEMWYSTRYCEATADADGNLDHSRCDGHRERVFATKNDARSAPDALQELIGAEINKLAMPVRDPKDSGSPASSSEPSPLPSEAAESTPSTSTPTPSAAPGTSVPPSPTLSPSSAGTS